jgi:hypothetical protein
LELVGTFARSNNPSAQYLFGFAPDKAPNFLDHAINVSHQFPIPDGQTLNP